ncbi:MAG: flagellar hook-basal body complex protein [Rickettsiaceae bacterium]|nr:flagellar hook-basal body complex protein [Rickettsiaceae bacterium]
MADSISYTAASGMLASMADISNRANNLANLNSLAYKAIETETKDTAYRVESKAGSSAIAGEKPVSTYYGTGVQVTGTYRNLAQGTRKPTGDPLNVYISGSGYFAINLPNNVRGFTRAGAFKLNNQGQIVTTEGYTLVDDITLPQDVQSQNVKISAQGQVTATNNAGDDVVIGQLRLYTFTNEQGLIPQTKSYYTESEASGEAVEGNPGDLGFGELEQYAVELSNVEATKEFASFMAAQRAYELCARMLRVSEEMQKELNK